MTADRPRFEHWFRCRACGCRFHVTRLTDDPAKVKTPPCPRKTCASKRTKPSYVPDIPMDVAAGKAPAVGGAIETRAMDIAMEVAAHNAGVTDLNDRPRYGENSAPKLAPRLQAQVDNFWPDPKRQRKRTGRIDLSGIYGDRARAAQGAGPKPQAMFNVDAASAIGPIHTAGESGRPPTIIMNPPGTY